MMTAPERLAPGQKPAVLARYSSTRRIILTTLVAVFLVAVGVRASAIVRHLSDANHYAHADTGHYLLLAHQVASGDFTFGIIATKLNRGILISMLWAPFVLLFGPGLVSLRLVNALVCSAAVFPAYASGRDLFGRRAGLWSALGVAFCAFYLIYSVILYSEAVFIPLYFTALWLLGRALDGRGPFWHAGALVGLCYLARTSGLVLAFAVACVLLIRALARFRSTRLWLNLLSFLVAFAVAGSPLPITKICHGLSPLAHGSTGSILWAESYQEVKADDANPTAASWIQRHRAHPFQDALQRMGVGLSSFLYGKTPHRYGYVLHVLGLVGMCVALLRRTRLWLVGLFVFQLLPMAWAYQAAPDDRLILGALCPLLTLWAGFAIETIWSLSKRISRGHGSLGSRLRLPCIMAAVSALLHAQQAHLAMERLRVMIVGVAFVIPFLRHPRVNKAMPAVAGVFIACLLVIGWNESGIHFRQSLRDCVAAFPRHPTETLFQQNPEFHQVRQGLLTARHGPPHS